MNTTTTATATPAAPAPDELAGELAGRRDVAAVKRGHQLAEATAKAGHRRDRADLAARQRQEDLARADREATAQTRAQASRLRVKAIMRQSAEARQMHLDASRSLALRSLLPIMVILGGCSAAGVHEGAVRLIGVTSGPLWWAMWTIEPACLGIVVVLIVLRARLARVGGSLGSRAERVGLGALSLSIGLNAVAVDWNSGNRVGSLFLHLLCPVGCAGVAYLIGLIEESIAKTDPWTIKQGDDRVPAPTLDELLADIPAPENAPEDASENASENAFQTASEGASGPAPETASEGASETASRRASRPASGRTRKAAPRTASRGSSRTVSDAELADRMRAAITAGELPGNASVRAVQAHLNVGAPRARTVRDAVLGTVPDAPEHETASDVVDAPVLVSVGGAG